MRTRTPRGAGVTPNDDDNTLTALNLVVGTIIPC